METIFQELSRWLCLNHFKGWDVQTTDRTQTQHLLQYLVQQVLSPFQDKVFHMKILRFAFYKKLLLQINPDLVTASMPLDILSL